MLALAIEFSGSIRRARTLRTGQCATTGSPRPDLVPPPLERDLVLEVATGSPAELASGLTGAPDSRAPGNRSPDVDHEPALPRLLRKEVIQPHLPVRLPCYDFTPIADPTFDSSLSYELGHWLRVLPTFVV